MRGAGSGIGEVTVKKAELLEILRSNKGQHRQLFEIASEEWLDQAKEGLSKLVKEIRERRVVTLFVNLPLPEEHTADYDRAIRMLEMHVEETVTLDEEAYAQLVDDDWGWKDQFNRTTAYYAATNVDKRGGRKP